MEVNNSLNNLKALQNNFVNSNKNSIISSNSNKSSNSSKSQDVNLIANKTKSINNNDSKIKNNNNNNISQTNIHQHQNNSLNQNKVNNDNAQEAREHFEMELKIAFDLFDEDGSGAIDKEEFGNVMKKLGLNPTKVEIQEMLEIMDKENIGQIDFENFKKIMTKSINDDFLIDSSIEAFSLFDKNKSGKLEKKELIKILVDLCYMDKEEAEELISEEYFDDKNEIDYIKFVRDTFDLLNY